MSHIGKLLNSETLLGTIKDKSLHPQFFFKMHIYLKLIKVAVFLIIEINMVLTIQLQFTHFAMFKTAFPL